MLKCLGVLAITAIVAGACSANRKSAGVPLPNAGTATSAQSDKPAAQFDPCKHGVYERLREGLLARPVRLDDRDRNYLFELDRLCREHTESADPAMAKGSSPQQVPDGSVAACVHPVYTSLRESVYADPGRLKDEDHWYFHELDRACIQGKSAVADKTSEDAAKITMKKKSNHNPSHWLAFLTGLGALTWNLLVSAR